MIGKKLWQELKKMKEGYSLWKIKIKMTKMIKNSEDPENMINMEISLKIMIKKE